MTPPGSRIKTLGRAQIVDEIYTHGEISRRETADLFEQVLAVIADELVAGGSVMIVKFGGFHPRRTKPRVGRDPRHPEQQHAIPSHIKIAFKPATELRQFVSRRKPPQSD